MSLEEARFPTGSHVLGNAINSLIELIPNEWSSIVSMRIKKPFQQNDWVIARSECNITPWNVYKVTSICT
jgi:hypothetical protein